MVAAQHCGLGLDDMSRNVREPLEMTSMGLPRGRGALQTRVSGGRGTAGSGPAQR